MAKTTHFGAASAKDFKILGDIVKNCHFYGSCGYYCMNMHTYA